MKAIRFIQALHAGVSVGEAADLQVDDNETPQSPVEKQQVHPVPLAPDTQSPLPAHEAEIIAQFQEESTTTSRCLRRGSRSSD